MKGCRTVTSVAAAVNIKVNVIVIIPRCSDNQQGTVKNGEGPLILSQKKMI